MTLKKITGPLGTLLLICLMLLSTQTQSQTAGQTAPDFSANSTNGKMISLRDLKGQWVVLYFYPKAFTPGCTKESCALRDSFKEIEKTGAVILGVSLDDIATQIKFKEKYHLPFELLSDVNKKISQSYNTLGLFGLYAKRITFIISPEGKIAHVFDKVQSASHDQQVLKKLLELKTKAVP